MNSQMVRQTERVAAVIEKVFGWESLVHRKNRAAQVLEEAAELAQAEGVQEHEAAKILARTFSRPVGEPRQEGAGVMVTLLAWSVAAGHDLEWAADDEITRMETIDPEVFRAKQREKHALGTDFAEPIC